MSTQREDRSTPTTPAPRSSTQRLRPNAPPEPGHSVITFVCWFLVLAGVGLLAWSVLDPDTFRWVTDTARTGEPVTGGYGG